MIAKIGKKAAEETVNGAIFQIGLGKKINASDSLTSVDARTQWHQLDTTRGLRCVQGATTTSTTSCGRSWRTASCTPTTSSSASSWRPWTGSSRYETKQPRDAAILIRTLLNQTVPRRGCTIWARATSGSAGWRRWAASRRSAWSRTTASAWTT